MLRLNSLLFNILAANGRTLATRGIPIALKETVRRGKRSRS
jgi:hypothetical protein